MPLYRPLVVRYGQTWYWCILYELLAFQPGGSRPRSKVWPAGKPQPKKLNLYEMNILRHLVVEYRRTRNVLLLNPYLRHPKIKIGILMYLRIFVHDSWIGFNRTCAFQPDGFGPRLNCLTSWLNRFFTLNQVKNGVTMTNTIWITIFLMSWLCNDFDMTLSWRHG